MLRDHPTAEDFEGFFRCAHGPRTAARDARILRHLLAECSSCRHLLRAIGWGENRLERLVSYPADREEDGAATTVAHYDYNQSFAAAEQALNAFFAEGRMGESSPEELLAELAPLSQDEQERRVRSYSRFADARLEVYQGEAAQRIRPRPPLLLGPQQELMTAVNDWVSYR